jgi:transcription factor 1
MVLRVESWNCSDIQLGMAREARGRTLHVPEYVMLSPLRANHLVARLPRLSLNCTRNIASTSDESKKRGRPRKPVKVALKKASEPLPPPPPLPTAQPEPDAQPDSLPAALLNHYYSLPPLPPVDDWLLRFPYTSSQVRDRISIRETASAIRVAHSFLNSNKTSTNNPKVIVEAFPGVPRLKSVVTSLSCPV